MHEIASAHHQVMNVLRCVCSGWRNAAASARSAGGVRLAATADDAIEGAVESVDGVAAARSAAAAATAEAPPGGVSS